MQKRNYADAKVVFENIIKNDKKNARAYYYLASIHLTRGFQNEEKAVDLAEQALKLDPSNAEHHYILGAAHGMKAREAGVIKQAFLAGKIKNAFSKAVELNPKHLQARIGLAQFYMMAPGVMGGDKDKASEHVEAIIN